MYQVARIAFFSFSNKKVIFCTSCNKQKSVGSCVHYSRPTYERNSVNVVHGFLTHTTFAAIIKDQLLNKNI